MRGGARVEMGDVGDGGRLVDTIYDTTKASAAMFLPCDAKSPTQRWLFPADGSIKCTGSAASVGFALGLWLCSLAVQEPAALLVGARGAVATPRRRRDDTRHSRTLWLVLGARRWTLLCQRRTLCVAGTRPT